MPMASDYRFDLMDAKFNDIHGYSALSSGPYFDDTKVNLMKQIVYIGTYTDQPDLPQKRSEGIFIFNLDTEAKTLEKIGAVPDSPNPSFLALTNDQQILVSANELSSGAGQVTAYDVDTTTGMLTF